MQKAPQATSVLLLPRFLGEPFFFFQKIVTKSVLF